MNILIISYDYSEKSLASSFRARNLAIYLRANNYNVKVITSKHDNQEEIISIDSHFIENRKFMSKIYLRSFYFPDPVAYWAKKVINFLERNPKLIIDADKIIVTSPPHSLQLIAIWIKRRYPNKEVISDFRDAFVTNHRVKWYTPIHFFYAQYMEKKIFQSSDIIIANTISMRNDFRKKYLSQFHKIKYIPNGYVTTKKVEKKYCNNDSVARSIKLGYFGDSYSGEIANIIAKFLNESSKVKFITCGKGDWKISSNYKPNKWEHLGVVSQEDVKIHIDRVDILLLVMPKGEKDPSPTIPLKVYEYLASNKPIIYFGPKGDCWDLLENYANSYCYKYEDLKKLNEILENLKIFTFDRLDFKEKFNFNRVARAIINLEEF